MFPLLLQKFYLSRKWTTLGFALMDQKWWKQNSKLRRCLVTVCSLYIESFSAWQEQVLDQEAQDTTLKLNWLLEFCPGVFQCARQISSTGAKLLMPVSSSEVWCSSVQGNQAVYLVLSTYFRDWFGRYVYLIQSNCGLLLERWVLLLLSNLADVFLPFPCLRCSDCVAAGWSWLSLMGVHFPL